MATPSRILSTLARQGMPSMWEDLGAVGPAM